MDIDITIGKPNTGKSFWLLNEKRKELILLCSEQYLAELLLTKIDDEILQHFIDKLC